VEKKNGEAIIFLSGLGLLATGLFTAFSRQSRNEIGKRSGGKDEITGLPLHHFEASHIDHSRSSSDYDDAENGVATNPASHLFMHIVDELNGLPPAQNAWAIRQLKNRLNMTEEEWESLGQWIKLRGKGH